MVNGYIDTGQVIVINGKRFRILAPMGSFGYNRFPAKSSGIEDVSVLDVALNAKYFIPLRPNIDIGIGAGLELFSRDFNTLDFGYDLDVGYLWRLSRRLMLELGVIYHSHFYQQVWFIQTHGGLVFPF